MITTSNNILSEIRYSIWLFSEQYVTFRIFVVSATTGMIAIVKFVIIIILQIAFDFSKFSR